MAKDEIKIREALLFAKKEILETPENGKGVFVLNFIEQFVKDLKAAGTFDKQNPEDFLMNGVLVGYALFYTEQKQLAELVYKERENSKNGRSNNGSNRNS